MGGREPDARGHVDGDLERGIPGTVPPKRDDGEHGDGERTAHDDAGLAVHSVAEREADRARRHDEPEHQRVKVPVVAERDRGHRQQRDEQRHREAMHDADARQRDRDSVEISRYGHRWNLGAGAKKSGRRA